MMDHKQIHEILARPSLSMSLAEVSVVELSGLARLASDGLYLPDARKHCEMLEKTLRHVRHELAEARTEIGRLNSCETRSKWASTVLALEESLREAHETIQRIRSSSASEAGYVPPLSEADWARVPGGRDYGNGFRDGYELARSRSRPAPEEGGAS